MSPPDAKGATILLCLDMQPVFIRSVPDGPSVLRRCKLAVGAARGLGIRAVFTEQVPGKLGATDPSLLSLADAPQVLAKDSFSALRPGSGPAAEIAARGAFSHVLVCGVETPVCVYQTAADAIAAGLGVTVLSDCVGARRQEDASVCLADLAREGARILAAETVFYSLLGGASHPFFRAYTQLVKLYA